MLKRIFSFLISFVLLGISSVFADLESIELTIDDNTPGVTTDYHMIISADTELYAFMYGKIVMPGVDFTNVTGVTFSIDGGEEFALVTGTQTEDEILLVWSVIIIPEGSTVDIKISGVLNPEEAGAYEVDEFLIGWDDISDYASGLPTYNFILWATLSETTAIRDYTNDTTPSYVFTSNKAGTIIYGGSCSSETTEAVVGTNTIIFDELEEGTYNDCTIIVEDAHENVSETLEVSEFTVDTTAPVIEEIEQIRTRTLAGSAIYRYRVISEEPNDPIATPPVGPVWGLEIHINETDTPGEFVAYLTGTEIGGPYSFTFYHRDQAGNHSEILTVGPFAIVEEPQGSIIMPTSAGSQATTDITPPAIEKEAPAETTATTEPETTVTPEMPAIILQKEKYIFSTDITPRRKNSEQDVRALQKFLNQYEGESLAVTGLYDAETIAAVNRFQLKYTSEILAPWGIDYATGNVGIYTRKKIESLMNNS